ncbi:MAG: hypothetical protein KJ927_05735 [Candidatus Eisenbacteria bacterium]|nr:hypothetical protein [Candidatus Eisenbacteria bacterium]
MHCMTLSNFRFGPASDLAGAGISFAHSLWATLELLNTLMEDHKSAAEQIRVAEAWIGR